jgi:hypothetical protein
MVLVFECRNGYDDYAHQWLVVIILHPKDRFLFDTHTLAQGIMGNRFVIIV